MVTGARTHFKAVLADLVKYARQVVAYPKGARGHFRHPDFSGHKPEEVTKQKLLEPFLEALGYSRRLRQEVERGIGVGWVDYQLNPGPGVPPIFVEAKSITESSIWEANRKQIYTYIQDYRISAPADRDPTRWFVITNFVEIHILRLSDREPHWTFKLDELEQCSDLIYDLLAQENVRDGIIEAKYDEEQKGDLDRRFLEDLKRWRLILAAGFLRSNPSLNPEELESVSQTYVDRLIFIRILESYRLRPISWLARLYRNWKAGQWSPQTRSFASEVALAFKEVEFCYNTELFAEGLCDQYAIPDEYVEAVIIPDQPISESVMQDLNGLQQLSLWNNTIYNYDFSKLDPVVLGSVYERFLAHEFEVTPAKKVRIKGSNDATLAKRLRRKEGIYYTPSWVTSFIAQKTLGDRLQGLLARAKCLLDEGDYAGSLAVIMSATQIRLADISMGSGSFLLQCFDIICDYYSRYNAYVQELRDKAFSAGQNLMQAMAIGTFVNDHTMLALHNLYGVDLDPNAVEVARLSLWLRILSKNAEMYRKVQQPKHLLPSLELNLKCGNSLIDPSSLRQWTALITSRGSDIRKLIEAHGRAMRGDQSGVEEYGKQYISLAEDIASELEPIFHERLKDIRPFVFWLNFPQAFMNPDGSLQDNPGFDFVIGNPPYEVLSYKERGISQEEERQEKVFLDATYSTRFQKYNLYRFFIERGLDLLRDGGSLGYIVPMTLLADESSYKVRLKMWAETTPRGFYCFPEKARVFEDVTQAVTIAILDKKRYSGGRGETAWRQGVSPTLTIPVVFGLMGPEDLSGASLHAVPIERLKDLDERFWPVPMLGPEGWKVLDKMSKYPTLRRWEEDGILEVKQREINLNEDRELYGNYVEGLPLIRGDHIRCFDVEFGAVTERVNEDAFMKKKGGGRFRSGNDHKQSRIGIQEVVNLALIDRVKAAPIPAGYFLGHTVDYIILRENHDSNLKYLLGMLNSRIIDWRFRITSTNNHVSTNAIRAFRIPKGNENERTKKGRASVERLVESIVETTRDLRRAREIYRKEANQYRSRLLDLTSAASAGFLKRDNLLDDVNKVGIVTEIWLSADIKENGLVVKAAISYDENYRAAPKSEEEVLRLTGTPAQMDLLALELDAQIGAHGGGKWTREQRLSSIFDTVLAALKLRAFDVGGQKHEEVLELIQRRIALTRPMIRLIFECETQVAKLDSLVVDMYDVRCLPELSQASADEDDTTCPA